VDWVLGPTDLSTIDDPADLLSQSGSARSARPALGPCLEVVLVATDWFSNDKPNGYYRCVLVDFIYRVRPFFKRQIYLFCYVRFRFVFVFVCFVFVRSIDFSFMSH
jgi:hypothetical protein